MTRILVIESELRARHALRNILEQAGYDVELAADPEEGHRQHCTRPADLVIVDGVDVGPRFLGARLLAVPGGCAGREREVAERVRRSGAQFLPKPFRRDDLLAAVRSTLGMPPRMNDHLGA